MSPSEIVWRLSYILIIEEVKSLLCQRCTEFLITWIAGCASSIHVNIPWILKAVSLLIPSIIPNFLGFLLCPLINDIFFLWAIFSKLIGTTSLAGFLVVALKASLLHLRITSRSNCVNWIVLKFNGRFSFDSKFSLANFLRESDASVDVDTHVYTLFFIFAKMSCGFGVVGRFDWEIDKINNDIIINDFLFDFN